MATKWIYQTADHDWQWFHLSCLFFEKSFYSPQHWWHSGAAGVDANLGGLWYEKQTGGDVCFNIERCKTSGAQSSLLNQDSALSSWKRCLSLQAILLALGVCFNHFCCCVHLPSGKSKWHAMSTIRTDNKNENQTSDSAIIIQGNWRN